ncbi:MAG: ribonuclease HII, partial [Candidatus Aenigmatarchaeota archaeon]
VEIIADHKMDEKNLVVAAASIIGKVIRDREIEKIKREINFDFGSGYVSDEKTRKFLEKVFQEKKDYDFIRKAWITYEEESKKIRLKKIIDFI